MAIAKKKSLIRGDKTKAKGKSTTPRINPADINMEGKELIALFGLIERAKTAGAAAGSCATKASLLDNARSRIFEQSKGAFIVELGDGKTIMVKPSTRRYALTALQAESIEELIDQAGYDAGDYYHESHKISIDADTAHARLGEDKYMDFQADLGDLMAKYKLGDSWNMTEEIIAKEDFHESRHKLPPELNMDIEKIKPSTISIEAKREL